MMTAPTLADGPLARFWPEGMKAQAMEDWSGNVMADIRTTRTELKVAWALSFAFNDKDARAWPTHETLGKKAGLSAEAVRIGIRGLVKNGHLLRFREKIAGKMMVVSRPTLNARVVERQPPRPRKGGRPSTTPLVDPQPVRVVDPQPPCILDLSLSDPLTVEGVRTWAGEWDDLPPPAAKGKRWEFDKERELHVEIPR